MAADSARVEIELLPGYKQLPAAVEDGATFEENAIKKALHYGPHAAGLLFADDSGLEVEALGGAPGVYSARFSGPHATDDSNNRLLLERLRGVANRKARFVCAIALVEGERVVGVYHGAVEGDDSRRASRHRRLRLRPAVLLPGFWLHVRRGDGGTEVLAEPPGTGRARDAGEPVALLTSAGCSTFSGGSLVQSWPSPEAAGAA